MTTLDFLDAAKKKLGIESDYALSKALGLTTSAISNYRSGRSRMDAKVALKVAKAAGIDPIVPMAAVEAERAKDPEVRAVWESLLEKISKGFNDLLSHVSAHGDLISAR